MSTNNSNTVYGDPSNIDIFENSTKTKFGIRLKNDLSAKRMEDVLNKINVSFPNAGDTINARLVSINNNEALFDAGYKDLIRVNVNKMEEPFLGTLEVGSTTDVYISNIAEKPFNIQGSIAKLFQKQVNSDLSDDTVVTIIVNNIIPAGYNCTIMMDGMNIQAFMPNTLAGANKLNKPEALIGQTMEVVIESYSDDMGTYIVSRKRYLNTLIKDEIKKLKYKTAYEGIITGTTPFGVFVEFNNCLTGMIHKTNIHPEWVERWSELVAGMTVEFLIKEIVDEKIFLTQIEKDTLWDTVKVHQKIKAVLHEEKQNGVLVKLDDETYGLIHTSEIDKAPLAFEKGKEINTKVLAVDRLKRKIFLTHSI